jgi:hypothetical protein
MDGWRSGEAAEDQKRRLSASKIEQVYRISAFSIAKFEIMCRTLSLGCKCIVPSLQGPCAHHVLLGFAHGRFLCLFQPGLGGVQAGLGTGYLPFERFCIQPSQCLACLNYLPLLAQYLGDFAVRGQRSAWLAARQPRCLWRLPSPRCCPEQRLPSVMRSRSVRRKCRL